MTLSMVMPIGISAAQTGMVQAQKTFEKAAQAVASGLNTKISPADSYVASGLDSSIRGSKQAVENAQTGFNFAAQADVSLNSINQNYQRIRELSIQASNGIYSSDQRAAIQAEIDQNVSQIQQTLANSTFNGKQTLNAVTPENPTPSDNVDFMVGTDSTSMISYNPNISMDSMNYDVSTPQAAQATLAQVDSMISAVGAKRGEIGAVQSSFEGAIDQQMTNIMNTSAALSDVQDTDYVSAIMEMKQSQFSMEVMAKVMKTVMNSERYVLDLL